MHGRRVRGCWRVERRIEWLESLAYPSTGMFFLRVPLAALIILPDIGADASNIAVSESEPWESLLLFTSPFRWSSAVRFETRSRGGNGVDEQVGKREHVCRLTANLLKGNRGT